MIEHLWIYTSIAGSIIGAMALYWIKDTYIAFWVLSRWDQTLDFLVNKCRWTWLKHDPNAWKEINPKISAKLEELENRIADIELKK